MFQMSVISVSFVLISAQLNLLFTCLLYSPQNAERDALERRRTPRMESYGVLSSRSLLIISCLGSRVYRLFISLRRRHGENREVRSEKREPSPKNQDLTKVSLKRGKTRSQQYVVQGAKSSWGHTIYGHTYTEAYIIWQIYMAYAIWVFTTVQCPSARPKQTLESRCFCYASQLLTPPPAATPYPCVPHFSYRLVAHLDPWLWVRLRPNSAIRVVC